MVSAIRSGDLQGAFHSGHSLDIYGRLADNAAIPITTSQQSDRLPGTTGQIITIGRTA
jgi:hypothetical protein